MLGLCRIVTYEALRDILACGFAFAIFGSVSRSRAVKTQSFVQENLLSLFKAHDFITVDCSVIGAFTKETSTGGRLVSVIALCIKCS